VDTKNPPQEGDEVVRRAGEVSLRMMANAIPKRTHERVRGLLANAGDEYPWREVVDEVLAEPIANDDLLARGLRAQRDWFSRTAVPATARAGRAVRVAGKTALAFALSRAIFFVIYTLAVVVLLVLAKHHWPWCDIYRLLDWLRDTLPGVFRK
jgi:hypothetical protein